MGPAHTIVETILQRLEECSWLRGCQVQTRNRDIGKPALLQSVPNIADWLLGTAKPSGTLLQMLTSPS